MTNIRSLSIRHDKANMSHTKRHPLTPGRGTGGSAWLDYRVAALKIEKKAFSGCAGPI